MSDHALMEIIAVLLCLILVLDAALAYKFIQHLRWHLRPTTKEAPSAG